MHAIGSAGKTFSLTGWKVGYVTARLRWPRRGQGAPEPDLHDRAQSATRGGPRIGQGRRLFRRFAARCRPSAIGWLPAWRASAWRCCPPRAATSSPPTSPVGLRGDDVAFCRHITEQAVTAIPVTAFYDAPERRAITHASRSASATRCWTRRWRGCSGISGGEGASACRWYG